MWLIWPYKILNIWNKPPPHSSTLAYTVSVSRSGMHNCDSTQPVIKSESVSSPSGSPGLDEQFRGSDEMRMLKH